MKLYILYVLYSCQRYMSWHFKAENTTEKNNQTTTDKNRNKNHISYRKEMHGTLFQVNLKKHKI